MPAPKKAIVESAEVADWGTFKIAMLSDEAYQRVSQLSDKLTVGRVETFFSIEGEEIEIAVHLWKLMIQAVPEAQRPVSTEVERWKAITRATHMPITFDDHGLLHLNDEHESRFWAIESQLARVVGAVETFKALRGRVED